jgi:murein peptide amidase A
VRSFIFGHASSGLPIIGHEFGGGDRPIVLILGGVHGDEVEGVVASNGLLESFAKNFPYELRVVLVPTFNIDGVLAKTRVNARGVDLNRNLPTKDWNPKAFNPRYPPGPFANSEVENQDLVNFLKEKRPRLIMSLHSWKPMLNINGDCRPEAEVISALNGYLIEETIGYPTPGCLGTYGIENNSPVLTYEIERGLSHPEILHTHCPAILEALKVSERRFARNVHVKIKAPIRGKS